MAHIHKKNKMRSLNNRPIGNNGVFKLCKSLEHFQCILLGAMVHQRCVALKQFSPGVRIDAQSNKAAHNNTSEGETCVYVLNIRFSVANSTLAAESTSIRVRLEFHCEILSEDHPSHHTQSLLFSCATSTINKSVAPANSCARLGCHEKFGSLSTVHFGIA